MNSEVVNYPVASVVLNYNSDADVMVLLPQLLAQEGVSHSIIIVDNASQKQCVQRLVGWFQRAYPQVIIGSSEEVTQYISNHETNVSGCKIYFVFNNENRGYSAGNNIGIKLAEIMGVKAVLIANPDMRINNKLYISEMVKILFEKEKHYIAATRVLDMAGADQNPLRESSYFEELFWPIFSLRNFYMQNSYVIPHKNDNSEYVNKVSGCCFLAKISFLKQINYLDEGVFLYCEEPILAAQVKSKDGLIVYIPQIKALHIHDKTKKGNVSERMELFIRSRKYYLTKYRLYGRTKMLFLSISYSLLKFYTKAKLL